MDEPSTYFTPLRMSRPYSPGQLGPAVIGDIALLQSAEATESGGDAQVTGFTVAAGNSLIFIVHWSHATVTWSNITISGEANASIIGSSFATGISNTHLVLARLDNITTGGSKTITCNWSGAVAGAAAFWVAELSGTNTGSLLGQEGTNTGNSGTSSVNLTTATDKEMGIAVVCANSGEPDPGAGFTRIALFNPNRWSEGCYDLNLGSPGAKTISMTQASGTWAIKAATLKASGT